jgi:redox-sensitive bicupin YhaK (pirin superfamily)
METITYMISGSSEHADNMGHQGRIGSGDVQWMTAGSGVIHQEMPQATVGRLQGFQLWVNLPGEKKMIPPRYQEIKKEMIPVVHPTDGVEIRITAGKFGDSEGPVKELVVPIQLFDVSIIPEKTFEFSLPAGWTTFAYVFEGEGIFGPEKWRAGPEHLVIFGEGEKIQVRTDEDYARFLLAAGQPIHEPIAWRGPVVMNTDEEVREAFREIREGTFVKRRS